MGRLCEFIFLLYYFLGKDGKEKCIINSGAKYALQPNSDSWTTRQHNENLRIICRTSVKMENNSRENERIEWKFVPNVCGPHLEIFSFAICFIFHKQKPKKIVIRRCPLASSRESLAWKWKTVKIFLDSLADAPTLWHLLHELSPTLPACPLSECLSPIAW